MRALLDLHFLSADADHGGVSETHENAARRKAVGSGTSCSLESAVLVLGNLLQSTSPRAEIPNRS